MSCRMLTKSHWGTKSGRNWIKLVSGKIDLADELSLIFFSIILLKNHTQGWRFTMLIRHATHEETWLLSVQVPINPHLYIFRHHLPSSPLSFLKDLSLIFPWRVCLRMLSSVRPSLSISPNKALPEASIGLFSISII